MDKHAYGTVAEIAAALEGFNGWGYRKRGVPSPYLWAGSDQYAHGKYGEDGVYDGALVDKQLGVMVLLKALTEGGSVALVAARV